MTKILKAKVSNKVHQRAKVLAAVQGMSLTTVIHALVLGWLDEHWDETFAEIEPKLGEENGQ